MIHGLPRKVLCSQRLHIANKVVIVGDFNIHMDSECNFNHRYILTLKVGKPTKSARDQIIIAPTVVVIPRNPVLSDHYLITFQLSPDPILYFSRKLSSRTADAFSS